MLQKDKYIFILIFDQIIAEMMCLIRYCWNSFIPIFMIRAVLGEPIPFFSLFSLAHILSTTAAAAAALRVMHQRCAMQPNYLPHASKSSSAIPQELHLIYERIIIKKKMYVSAFNCMMISREWRTSFMTFKIGGQNQPRFLFVYW